MTQDKPTDQSSGSAHVEDDVKRKFREALEKKQGHGGKDVSDHSEHGKVDHAARAKTSGAQQMFRRKSGG
ncbi:DUF5302 domain-containing protein [Ornithinimicrobium sp. F0845]|uniref:DUF5302 domain-containing protein n=1 Tax=Ornithinimicrobium sp. F0845 TaxID=2926412 RepID=UPI001FF49A1D|nr:DUF5302 domain-containing protein [Ornithinimicrobium sp. F0845]MCK0113974.1 DUF5302 domain-containing protein [Ornithinimicrobium sp. F0845]